MWPLMAVAADRWANDARYSHGILVPLFSLALLYLRRGAVSAQTDARANLWGLPVVFLGGFIQTVGGYVGSSWLGSLAMIPYFAGAALLWGGKRTLHWALPSILFLIFMIPLPWRLEVALGPPLQGFATQFSTYALQTLGLMASAQGNIVRLGDFKIGVVEACSGLSMLMSFFALSTAAALVIQRPLLDRMLLALAAVPVALVANTARIVLTAVLCKTLGSRQAETFYHSLAGWVMIPFALALLWILERLWSWIVTEQDAGRRPPILVGLNCPNASQGPAARFAVRHGEPRRDTILVR
jgi:exosortase